MLERMLRTSTSCMQPCFTLLLCGKHACIVYDTWNEMRHTHAIFSSMLVALSLHSRTHPCSLTSVHKFTKQATYRSCSHKGSVSLLLNSTFVDIVRTILLPLL